MRLVHFIFGCLAYVLFNAVFMYFTCFLLNFMVPKSIDIPVTDSDMYQAVMINLFLIVAFAIHHSSAPRDFFKKWLKERLPEHLHRSVYVMLASLFLAFLMWQWQALPQELWRVDNGTIRLTIDFLYVGAAILTFVTSFHVDHWDLFGVRHVYCHLVGKTYTKPHFDEKGLYRIVRHPIMLGTLLVLWVTPDMTVGHFLLSACLTVYIFSGTFLEERDLLVTIGTPYKNYKKEVPMFVPFFKWR